MESAANTMEQLNTLLKPHFEAIDKNMKDFKKGLEELSNKVTEIHDKMLSTSADVDHMKHRIDDNEARIKHLEEVSYDNSTGVAEFRRARHLAYVAIGSVVSALAALAAWGVSTYIDYIQHRDEVTIRQELAAEYRSMSEEVRILREKVDNNK